jgi:general L-amino acid transport system permease protein
MERRALIGRALQSAKLRAIVLQVMAIGLLVLLVGWLVGNTAENLSKRGIAFGFDFLQQSARFPISESLLNYSPTDTFAWALVVGFGNTLFISALVAITATLLGLVVGLARRSQHPLAAGMATTFVETLRNTPLVVQLLFWYALVTLGLPNVHTALEVGPSIFLTDRGLYVPALKWGVEGFYLERPELGHYNFDGGMTLTPEFVALILGLVLYSASFIGEIIRGGIDAVDKGQWEAGRAIGLTERETLRFVIFPQALRVIVPPLTSQYINIIKNTTLALVVGYPDIAFVTATTINQTGHAVEGIVILMIVFLTISIASSLLMNAYNRRLTVMRR